MLNDICAVLDTYKGRDKVFRTLCYSARLVSGFTKDELLVERLKRFSSQMSSTRAVLRLLDDLPMLKYSLEYGLGRQEPDKFMSTLGVVTNVIDQLYYPVEKISWFAEHRLITVKDSTFWDVACSIFWVVSTYLTLIKNLRYIAILQKHKMCLIDDSSKSGDLAKLIIRQKTEAVTCLRLFCDLIHSVSTLPAGYLWSGKLQPWQVNLVGTISSVIGLYQLFAKRRN